MFESLKGYNKRSSMKQDTKEVLNAIIDSLGLQIEALVKMNESIEAAKAEIADLKEALDENSDEIEKLRGEVAMLPKEGTLVGDKWPYQYPPVPYTPYYPPVLPTWTVNSNAAYEHAFPQS